MPNTWLADFTQRNDLDLSNLVRFRGGIGVKHGRETTSNFVGHPVHYLDAGEWKPITLAHSNGHFEGSDFGWNGYAVTHKKKILYQPDSITFNGVLYPLNFFLDADNHQLVAYVPGIGEYEIIFSEKGAREILTIPEPLDGLLTFQVQHEKKPNELYKHERRIIGGDLAGDEYLLTPDMTYPLVIDPDYSGTTGDGHVNSSNLTTYAAARLTSTAFDVAGNLAVGQYRAASNDWYIWRSFLKIDTSGIPDTDDVSQVNLKLVCVVDSSTTDFDIVIRKQDWSAQDPLAAGTREAAYDGCLAATSDDNIWRNTASLVINTQYASGNLSPTWVSKTGYTFYSLISSQDVANTAPAGTVYINIASQDHATSAYRPVLTVVHAAGDAVTGASLMMLLAAQG